MEYTEVNRIETRECQDPSHKVCRGKCRPYYKSCPNCFGTRKITAKVPCPTCLGHGKLLARRMYNVDKVSTLVHKTPTTPLLSKPEDSCCTLL